MQGMQISPTFYAYAQMSDWAISWLSLDSQKPGLAWLEVMISADGMHVISEPSALLCCLHPAVVDEVNAASSKKALSEGLLTVRKFPLFAPKAPVPTGIGARAWKGLTSELSSRRWLTACTKSQPGILGSLLGIEPRPVYYRPLRRWDYLSASDYSGRRSISFSSQIEVAMVFLRVL